VVQQRRILLPMPLLQRLLPVVSVVGLAAVMRLLLRPLLLRRLLST
jgi:hypothetical protein